MKGEEDEAWRSIVDNYGERAVLPDQPEERPDERPDERLEEQVQELVEADEAFVPPEPPPFLLPTPDRTLAWAGVFGAPVVMLVAVLGGIDLPDLIGWLLIGAFVGGFGYLLVRWPGEPRDPWDDGAQV